MLVKVNGKKQGPLTLKVFLNLLSDGKLLLEDALVEKESGERKSIADPFAFVPFNIFIAGIQALFIYFQLRMIKGYLVVSLDKSFSVIVTRISLVSRECRALWFFRLNLRAHSLTSEGGYPKRCCGGVIIFL